MTNHNPQLTGQLARSARALVAVSSKHVSALARLPREQLRDFEKGNAGLQPDELASLKLALEGLGAVFLSEGEDGFGHGVRLKFSVSRVEKIETWEGEGGCAAEDDV